MSGIELILTPPIAILVYIGLVALLYVFGRLLAPAGRPSPTGTSLYAGGEVAATHKAAPGYRRFFVVALFFAVLHLGALMLATAGLMGGAAVLGSALWVAVLFYVGGLALTLLILLLS
jgi:NADH:ubiquinone oxidoreductase subunit 3 (subunit A)